jgi:hypothetical protein
MDRIFIEAYHHEPENSALTGLKFILRYPEGEAEISILDMRPLSLAEQEFGIRALLLRLAEAITNAAQSPQGIISSPRPRD